MALNYIFVAFFVIAFLIALLKFVLTGDVQTFKAITEGMLEMAKVAVMDIALPLTGVMTFFLGILNVGEKAGIINVLARFIGPFFNKLFPEVPKDHPANGQMIMNFSANFLGLDNAATPFGLKAMQSLQELNPSKDTASNAQIMFLVLHTSGLQIIPLVHHCATGYSRRGESFGYFHSMCGRDLCNYGGGDDHYRRLAADQSVQQNSNAGIGKCHGCFGSGIVVYGHLAQGADRSDIYFCW